MTMKTTSEKIINKILFGNEKGEPELMKGKWDDAIAFDFFKQVESFRQGTNMEHRDE